MHDRPKTDRRRGAIRASAAMAVLVIALLAAMFAVGNITQATTVTPTPFRLPTPIARPTFPIHGTTTPVKPVGTATPKVHPAPATTGTPAAAKPTATRTVARPTATP